MCPLRQTGRYDSKWRRSPYNKKENVPNLPPFQNSVKISLDEGDYKNLGFKNLLKDLARGEFGIEAQAIFPGGIKRSAFLDIPRVHY